MNSAGLTVKHEAGAAGVEEGETGVAQDQRQVQCPPVISVISADNSVIIILVSSVIIPVSSAIILVLNIKVPCFKRSIFSRVEC